MSQTTQEPVTDEQTERQPTTKPGARTATKTRRARRAPRAHSESRARKAHPAGTTRTHRRRTSRARAAADGGGDRGAQTEGAVVRRLSDQYRTALRRGTGISLVTSASTFLTTWATTSDAKTLFITTATAFLAPFGARAAYEGRRDTKAANA
jgi:hypothetical protein